MPADYLIKRNANFCLEVLLISCWKKNILKKGKNACMWQQGNLKMSK